MKRTLSVLLALLALITVMCCFAVVSASTVDFSGYGTPTENGGLFGKDADEYAYAATGRPKYSVTMTTTDGDFAAKNILLWI